MELFWRLFDILSGSLYTDDIRKMREESNIKGLIKALKYEADSSVRKAAAEALGEIKDVRAVEPLIAILQDIDRDVAMAAAEALGEIKDARAVEPLILALDDQAGRISQDAMRALIEI